MIGRLKGDEIMADVTVKQLAQIVGIPVERLLTQLQEAGLSITDEQQVVKEDQKRVLLNHLKRIYRYRALSAWKHHVTPKKCFASDPRS